MTDVERSERHSTLRLARGLQRSRWMKSALAVVAVCSSTVAVFPRTAGASSITNDRAEAKTLYDQIQNINGRVELLGQKYDESRIKLDKVNN